MHYHTFIVFCLCVLCVYPQVFGIPFEEDAQCSHLVRLGIADVAATIDSDLLSFGCPLTLFGHVSTSKKPGALVRPGKMCCAQVNSMSTMEIVWMTCLTGCDYIDRLHGFSLQKAIDKALSWRCKSDEVRASLPPPPLHSHINPTIKHTGTRPRTKCDGTRR